MTREKGHYWFKPAPSEPWEPAEWDADNQCWWVCASETPWDEAQVSTIVIGPKIEPPAIVDPQTVADLVRRIDPKWDEHVASVAAGIAADEKDEA